MKLSQLIRYKSMVDKMEMTHIRHQACSKIQSMIDDIDEGHDDLDFRGNLLNLDASLDKIKDAFTSVDTVLGDIKKQLAAELTELEKQAMLDSYQIYENNAKWPDVTDHVFNRAKLTVLYDDYDVKHYRARIKLHGSWKHAGLVIRPLKGEYVDCMLPCDPLYVVDETQGLLRPMTGLFNRMYQRRLRYYTVDEEKRPLLTEKLPLGQLGFIHVHEFFTVRPISIIQEYLEEFWQLLKPGGVVMFMYNNGDIADAVKNFEAGLYCYAPGGLLKTLVESLGYEIVNSYDSKYNVSWLEIKKPGELESLRGGQTLGKIKSNRID